MSSSSVFERFWGTLMVSGWFRTTWGELAVLEYGKALRGYQNAAEGGARVYGTNGPIGWATHALGPGPAVVVGRKGAYRGVQYAEGPFWVIDTAYWLRAISQLNPRWAYYQLLTQDINGRDSGSAIPSLSRSDFYSLAVEVPPPHEQDAIAEVLAALDDKIDANDRLAALTLDLAKATYEEATASEAESVALGDVGQWLSGGTPNTSNPSLWGGPMPWISAASLKSFFVGSSDRTLTVEGSSSGTRVVPRGAILFVVRGMSLKTEFRIGVAQREVAFGQDCKAILVDERYRASTVAVGLAAVHATVLTLVDEAGHGTGRLPTDRIERMEIALPPGNRSSAVEEALSVLLARGAAAEEETRRLAALRDALLPPLMSGELRVHEAEALVGEAM